MSTEIGRRRSWDDLTEECWETILNQQHHESVSIVCKRFLSISNRLRLSFTITNPILHLHRSIYPFLHRFRHLKRISLVQIHGDLNPILHQIANSHLALEALHISRQKGIPLEGLKDLGAKMGNNSFKTLICSRLWVLGDTDLLLIAASMSELDIGSFQDC